MQIDIWLTLGVFLTATLALIFSKQRPAAIFALSTLLLLATGQLELQQVTHNLGNQGLITLILLLLVSRAIDKTSLIKQLGRKLLTASYQHSFWRLFALTFSSSAILNNTAIVATLIGPIKQNNYHPASKLLLPLSYAAILGGTVTLVGTSTNLIVNSFLLEQNHQGFNFFDFTLYGLVAGLTCGVLLFLLKPLLPEIKQREQQNSQYFIEAEVTADSPLIGKTVEQNHLRNLPQLFLVEIVRNNKLISPVCPDQEIEARDKLIFSGNINKVDSLNHIDGLSLYAETNGLLRSNLTEVVVSNRAKIIGKTLKQIGFRALFDAAVVAIRRDGQRLSGKLGEIKLQAGDFLLLATGQDFSQRHNLSKNFFILSEHNFEAKLPQLKEALTLGGFLCAILLAALSLVPLVYGLLFLLAALTFGGILSGGELKRHLPINLMMIIVGALSLASALENSGTLALVIATLEPYVLAADAFYALVAIYLLTLLLTELVTNNAAAALMFPFAYGVVQILDANLLLPFALAVAFGASASFISPYGYQTNLLVFSAGNYRFKHFVRLGLPISLLYSCLVLLLLKLNFSL